jgi:hypothetical protein
MPLSIPSEWIAQDSGGDLWHSCGVILCCRVACYLSDDGAALLTFEALTETASFARFWVPFCKKFEIEPRAPELYFQQVRCRGPAVTLHVLIRCEGLGLQTCSPLFETHIEFIYVVCTSSEPV